MIASGAVPQIESDAEIYCSLKYNIKEKSGKLRIRENQSVKKIYHGDRTVASESVFTYGSKKVTAEINGEKLSEYYANTIGIAAPEDFKSGDVFEYEIDSEYKDIVFVPIIFIRNDGYIKEWKLEIKHEKDIAIEFDFFFPRDSIPCVVTRDKKKTALEFKDIPYGKRLFLFPYNHLQSAILISVYREGELITPTTPSKFMQWYSDYASLKRNIDSSLHQELDSLLLNQDDDTVQLRIIHDYIRKNIRYMTNLPGSNGIIPNDPDSFYLLKYGDCKDRAMFVSRVADIAELDVEMGLVHTMDVPSFHGKVHPSLFNHVICAYPLEDSICYFDPTAKYSRFGNPLNTIASKEILILDPQNPRYEVLPPSGTDPSLEIRIKADLDSLESSTADIIVRNGLEYELTVANNEFSASEFENYFSFIMNRRISDMLFRRVLKKEEFHDRTEYTAEADISDLLIPSRNKIYISHLPFNIGDKDLEDRLDDNYPLTLGESFGIKLGIYLNAPRFRIEPDSIMHFLNEDIYYTASSKQEDSSGVKLEYYYRRIPGSISGETRNEFIHFGLNLMYEKKEMFTITGRNGEAD